jgi:uncharacterized protein YdiU (UPF0061 family)
MVCSLTAISSYQSSDPGSRENSAPLSQALTNSEALAPWLARWSERLARDPMDPQTRARSMRVANPAVIPRNRLVEAAIRDAEDKDDFDRFHRLVDELADLYSYNPERAWLARPPEAHACVHQTFCGT